MMLIRYLSQIGRYFLMWKEIFNKPTKWSVMKGLILKEIDDLIIGSLGIVSFISFFVGGVVAIQTALNLTNPLIPKYQLLYPFLIGISMFIGILGGFIASVYGGFGNSANFIEGIQREFIPFHIAYAFIKTFIFALLLATIPSFHGYYMKGGALEVGKASTVAFVWTSVTIILMNYILTQLLLT